MNLLTLNDGGVALRVGGARDGALIFELAGLGSQGSLGGLVVAVVELAVDDLAAVVDVLLGKDFGVVDGLDLAMVVVLVDLLVDGGVDLLVLGWADGFLLHGGCDLLLDGGVVVTCLGDELVDGLLCSIHDGELFVSERELRVNWCGEVDGLQ